MLSLERYGEIERRCRGYCSNPRIIVIGGGGSYEPAVMRRCYPDARMYCFEPASARREGLQSIMSALSVQVVPSALGNTNNYQSLHLSQYGMCNSLFATCPGPFEQLQREVGVETVPVVCLDDWCTQQNVTPADIGVLQLDVQGAELDVLKGAPKVLRHVQLVVLEVAFKPMYENAPLFGDIDVHMRASGFECALLMAAAIAPDVYGDAWYIRKEAAVE